MTDRPLALITGASSGIGAAMAATLAANGYDLVLVARRRERLEALEKELAEAGAASEVIAVDLSERSGIKLVADRAAAGDIDVLVSNAGVSAYGPFAEIAPEDLDRAWTLNADATPFLARAALPGMLERGRGGIITVASALAFSAGAPPARPDGRRSMPKRALYVSAKAGIVAFTSGARRRAGRHRRTCDRRLPGSGVLRVELRRIAGAAGDDARGRRPRDVVGLLAWRGALPTRRRGRRRVRPTGEGRTGNHVGKHHTNTGVPLPGLTIRSAAPSPVRPSGRSGALRPPLGQATDSRLTSLVATRYRSPRLVSTS